MCFVYIFHANHHWNWRSSTTNAGDLIAIRNFAALFTIVLAISGTPARAVDPSDIRQPIVLTAKEHSWMLAEMRGHLDATGTAQQALFAGDVEAARQAMIERGTARLKTPGRPNLSQKVTDEWKTMASGMHQSFDTVANAIADKESAPQVMGRIAKVMQYCAGCHSTYRLVYAP